MCILKNKLALSLTELLVASALMGIIMIGIVGFSASLKRIQESTRRSSVQSMELAGILRMIKADAELAIGDGGNLGIRGDDLSANNRSICFRKDVNGTPSGIPLYADDTWTCYYNHIQPGPGNRFLRICPGYHNNIPGEMNNVPPNNLVKCNNAPGIKRNLTENLTSVDFFNIVPAAGPINYIEVELKSAGNPTAAIDPAKNPQISYKIQINPSMMSR